jgi:hypothetical protein
MEVAVTAAEIQALLARLFHARTDVAHAGSRRSDALAARAPTAMRGSVDPVLHRVFLEADEDWRLAVQYELKLASEVARAERALYLSRQPQTSTT